MHKCRIRAYIPSRWVGQVGVVVQFTTMRGQMNFGIWQFAHLVVGNATPVTCYHWINAFETIGKVHYRHIELAARAALQEQYFVIVGNVHQLTQVLFGVVENTHKHVRTVTHGHHWKTCTVVIKHLWLRLTQHRFGQDSRSGRKIVNNGHGHGESAFIWLGWQNFGAALTGVTSHFSLHPCFLADLCQQNTKK